MAWQSSPEGNGDPRMSPSHGSTASGTSGNDGRGSPPAPGTMAHVRPGHPNYRPYHPPAPHHRPVYGAPHPPPPRYYDYEYSGYPPQPPPPSHGYAPPIARHFSANSPEQKSSPGDTYTAASPSVDSSFRTGGCTCKKSRCLKLYCQCFALSTTCSGRCKCTVCLNSPLHADSIEEARKTILERNPSAFDDKFKGPVTPSPYRAPPVPMYHHHASPPTTAWHASSYGTMAVPRPPMAVAPLGPPRPLRVNKFGCKCRRSFCLKKYCECYQNSAKCGAVCRCVNCKNGFGGNESNRPRHQVSPGTFGRVTPECSPETAVGPSVTPAAGETAKKADAEDRMAIMAAVAMTELFGSSKGVREAVDKGDESSENERDVGSESKTDPTVATTEIKRKVEVVAVVSSPEKSEDEDCPPPPKRARVEDSAETKMTPEQPESRNPSPVSNLTPQNFSYPPRSHFIHRPHNPPPHHPDHHRPYHPPPHHSFYGPRRGIQPYYPSAHQPSSFPLGDAIKSSRLYEDAIKSSGLPYPLSFRKVCSRCGKTRGEHGELGFGNKCVFQDCAKCKAGIQMHKKAGTPMGILCRLTVEQGAEEGAAKRYERKIRDLAARAELQKTMMEDKRERVERLAANAPFVSTA